MVVLTTVAQVLEALTKNGFAAKYNSCEYGNDISVKAEGVIVSVLSNFEEINIAELDLISIAKNSVACALRPARNDYTKDELALFNPDNF